MQQLTMAQQGISWCIDGIGGKSLLVSEKSRTFAMLWSKKWPKDKQNFCQKLKVMRPNKYSPFNTLT